MPYAIRKVKHGWVIRKGGKIVGHSATKAKAKASVKARLAAEHGFKLKGKR